MTKKYPSQQNRRHFWLSPEHLKIAKILAQQHGPPNGQAWSAKGVVESLLSFAQERHITPVSELKKK